MLRKLWNRARWKLSNRFEQFSDKAAICDKIREKQQLGHKVMVNLGAGARHHQDWINIDFRGDGAQVYSWDLRGSFPMPDQSCDVVYASHVIEHFDRETIKHFLRECCRVLKRNGIVRLVTPDLEELARAYLRTLDGIRNNEPDARARYDWISIELLDQMVRHRSGGEMLKYWSQPNVPAEDFIAERVGMEYWRSREYCLSTAPRTEKLTAKAVGQFRLGGEVHLWMYDQYSLAALLVECGFVSAKNRKADESFVENFAAFGLDTETDGSVYKPDSFFMEARVQ